MVSVFYRNFALTILLVNYVNDNVEMKEDDKAVDTEQLILRASYGEFTTKGFAGARTTAIAEQAGVTHAMLHYYFRTKERLYETVVRQKVNDIGNLVVKALGDDSLPLFERLEKGIGTHFDFLCANPELPRFVLSVLSDHPDFLMSMKDELHIKLSYVAGGLQSQIDEANSRGECSKADAMMLVLDIASLNIFPFIASPMLALVFNEAADNRDLFLARRKQENINTIINKLKP